jgi:ribonucleoside-diphosphate reductase alpha chain
LIFLKRGRHGVLILAPTILFCVGAKRVMMMLEKDDPSPFLDPAAVEVWDTWFRLREGGQLRDISVEATWERVARALAQAETAPPSRWLARMIDVQARWQVVFDERILAGAGTRNFPWPADPLAVLNAASFVRAPFTAIAHFDFDSFRAAADLAVHGLDNALVLHAAGNSAFADLRVGMMGIADALVLLGKRYDSPSGRVLAGQIAQALAEACLGANSRLARDRGHLPGGTDAAVELLRQRGIQPGLVESVQRTGLRHQRLTEITSQRRLARLANDVADALDPLDRSDSSWDGATPVGARAKRTGGYACIIAKRSGALSGPMPTVIDGRHRSSIAAQIALRGAVQPWIDAPIDYPFRVEHAPDAHATERLRQLAAANRLGDLNLAFNA